MDQENVPPGLNSFPTASESRQPPLKATVPPSTKRAESVLVLQMSYRLRLSRRKMGRKRKLMVFQKESMAATTIQCLFRKTLAEKRVARKKALAHFAKFMSNLRPTLLGRGLNEEDLLSFAVIKVQAAWRRRQAYFARVRAKNRRGFYNLIKERRQGATISDDEINDLAATFIQAKYRARQGYFAAMRRREALRQRNRHRAATKIQSWWRGRCTRARLDLEAQQRKMKKLAGFFSNVCFIKCFMIWSLFRQQQAHMKKVLGKVVVRIMKSGMFSAFQKLAAYADAQKVKNAALKKAAGHLFGSKDQARDQAWFAWRDLMASDIETNRKVAEKMGKFLGMGVEAMQRRCFDCWQDFVSKKRRALWKWKNSVLVRSWNEYREIVGVMRSNQKLLDRVRTRWMNWSVVVGMHRWTSVVEDRRWARHVIVHAIWRFSMRELAMPFGAMLEHAKLSKKGREITNRFARRFKLRVCHVMLLEWQDFASKETRKRGIIGRAKYRIQNQAVVGCMNEWKEAVQDRKLEERKNLAQGSQVLVRWLKRPMVDGFREWVKMVRVNKEQREKMRILMWRIRNASVVNTFDGWLEWLVILAEKRRVSLREAVKGALVTGSLMHLVQQLSATISITTGIAGHGSTVLPLPREGAKGPQGVVARSQPRAYREMLNEVMQEHFASEGDMVSSLATGKGAKQGVGAGKKKKGDSNEAVYSKEALRAMWDRSLDESVEEGAADARWEDETEKPALSSSRSSAGASPADVARIPPGQYILPPDKRSETQNTHTTGRGNATGHVADPDSDISLNHALFLDSAPLNNGPWGQRQAGSTITGPVGLGTGRGQGPGGRQRGPRATGRIGGQEASDRPWAGKHEVSHSRVVPGLRAGAHKRNAQGGGGGEESGLGMGGNSMGVLKQILPAYLQAGQGAEGKGKGRSFGQAARVAGRKGKEGGNVYGTQGGRRQYRVEEIEGVLRESVDDSDLEGVYGKSRGWPGVGGEDARPSSEGSVAVRGDGGEFFAGIGGEHKFHGSAVGQAGPEPPSMPVVFDTMDDYGGDDRREMSMEGVVANIAMFEKKARSGTIPGGTRKGRGREKAKTKSTVPEPRGGEGATRDTIPMPTLSSDEEGSDREPQNRKHGAGNEGKTRMPAIIQKGEVVQIAPHAAWGSGKQLLQGDWPEGSATGTELPSLTAQIVF